MGAAGDLLPAPGPRGGVPGGGEADRQPERAHGGEAAGPAGEVQVRRVRPCGSGRGGAAPATTPWTTSACRTPCPTRSPPIAANGRVGLAGRPAMRPSRRPALGDRDRPDLQGHERALQPLAADRRAELDLRARGRQPGLGPARRAGSAARSSTPSSRSSCTRARCLRHMFVYGPSLAAVDQYTGQMLWAKGPMAAQTEDEWLDRYQAAPAAARGARDRAGGPRRHPRPDATSPRPPSWRRSNRGPASCCGGRGWPRIAPLKITQSRYPRKIRILSSTPLVNEGVVYHVTNAGIVAAVDAQTGNIRWLTRYPQNEATSWTTLPTSPAPVVQRGPADPGRQALRDARGLPVPPVPRQGDRPHPVVRHAERRFALERAQRRPLQRLLADGRVLARRAPGADRLRCRLPGPGHREVHGEGWRLHKGRPCARTNCGAARSPKGLAPGITRRRRGFLVRPSATCGAARRSRQDGKCGSACRNGTAIPTPTSGPFNSEYCLDLKTTPLTCASGAGITRRPSSSTTTMRRRSPSAWSTRSRRPSPRPRA